MIDSCTNDRQSFVTSVSAGHVVRCLCHEGKADPESCDRFTLYRADGKPISTFVGRQYRCAQAPNGEITIYTERANVVSDTARTHSWQTPVRSRNANRTTQL